MNYRKRLITIVSLLATGLTASFAQTTAPATPAVPAPAPAAAADTPSSSWVITPSVASQYMFRGVRLGGPSFQPSVEFDYGALAVGVWANVPMWDKVDGQSDPEFDFYGSYSFDVVKDTATIVPGFTLYTYPNADRSNGFYKATFEPNLAFNYTIGIVKLTPKVYYDVVLKGPTAEFTASAAIPLKDQGTEIDLVATVGTFKWDDAVADSTPDTKNWGNYWLVGASMPFQITKDSKITPGIAYTDSSDNYYKQQGIAKSLNAAAVGRVVFTLSYAITF